MSVSTSPGAAWLGGFVATPVIFMGTDVLALALGFAAAIFMSAMLGDLIKTRRQAFVAAFIGALAGGYCSPLAAVAVAAEWPTFANAHDALRLPLSLLLGATLPFILPALVRARAKPAEASE